MGGSKEQTVGYKIYEGRHLSLCKGPIDHIEWIKVDDKKIWEGPSVGGRLVIDSPNIFGGESREGGISGEVDFEQGLQTQTANDYLSSVLGGTLIPAFRRISALVLRQIYIGLNPYPKPWKIRGKRIHVKGDGEAQWYNDKAEIAIASEEVITTIPAVSEWDYQTIDSIIDTTTQSAIDAIEVPISGYSTGTAPFGYAAPSGGLVEVYSIETPWFPDTSLWLRKTVIVPSSGVITISGHVENGALFYANGVLFASVNADNTQSATASGIPYSVSTSSLNLIPFTACVINVLVLDEESEEGEEDVDNTYFYGIIDALSSALSGDMNPAHVVREAFTDLDFGLGLSEEEDVDDEMMYAAADTLYEECMGISLMWLRTTSVHDFISEVLRHVDGVTIIDNSTGKIGIKLLRYDYNVEELITLDKSNSKVSNFSRVPSSELINEVTVQYWDSVYGTDKTVTVQNIALVQSSGGVNATKIDYPWFTNADIAARVAARDLRTLGFPRASCTVTANRIASQLRKGDVFKLSNDDYGVVSMVMRITDIDYGDGINNKITINCTQDTFSLPEIAFVTDAEVLWESSKTEPSPVENQIAVELPYFELVQRSGQEAVDSMLTSYPEAGYIGTTGVRPGGSELNARLWTDAGAGYEEYGTVDFCPSAILAEDVDFTSDTWALSGTVDLDIVKIGTWGQVDDELFSVVAISSAEITVGRAVLDTVPAEHLTGARLYFWDEFNATDEQQYVLNDEVDIKLQPVSSSGVVALADATAETVTLGQRAIRPYPPGNVQVNSEYYPDLVGKDDIAVDWAHRDRILQTAGLIPFTDGSIGPEDGTTYSLGFYGEDDELKKTVTGLEDTTYTWATELDDCEIPGGGLAELPYTPDVNEPVTWFDPSDTNSFLSEWSYPVEQWNDLSGNDNHAIQSTAASRPNLIKKGLNGLDVIQFDGSNDFFNILPILNTTSSAGSIFVVGRQEGSAAGALISTRHATLSQGFTLRFNNNTTTLYFHTGYSPNPTTTFAQISPGIFEIIRNGNSITPGVNGTMSSPSTISGFTALSTSNAAIGAEQESTGSFLNGIIGEILVTDGAVDSTTREEIEGYLAWKWGIQTLLPSGHTYKDSAPSFSPSELTNILWLDASNASSLTLSAANADSDYKSVMLDLSGNNKHAYQTIQTKKPLLTASAINGLSALSFNGSSMSMMVAPISDTVSDWTIAYVLKPDVSSKAGGMYMFDAEAGRLVMAPINSAGTGVGVLSDSTWYGTTAGTTNNQIVCGVFDQSAGAGGSKLYRNGVLLTSFDYLTQLSLKGFIGLGYTYSYSIYSFFDGYLGEFLIFPSALSAEDRQRVEGYLAWKWGLVDQLDASHPWKTSAPTYEDISSTGFRYNSKVTVKFSSVRDGLSSMQSHEIVVRRAGYGKNYGKFYV